ncbi:MAG TPA: TlpA disulfide reductase family protein [Gemmatimonadales bacterium]|jgi:peroxiredoxin|nr:TlpA disulfide reductase family protein [Gemmatimonadales bacterium]
MSRPQQWTVGIGVAMTLVFGTALVVKIRPQIDLVAVGSAAPMFRAKDLATGRDVSLGDYRGKVVLLNVWATWCAPCRVEMPSMQRLYHQLGGPDFRVVAVSIDEDGDSVVTAFAREMGVTFDILHDRTAAVKQAYQATGVPESWVLNRDGVIVKKVVGPSEWDAPVNEGLIRRLIDERAQ